MTRWNPFDEIFQFQREVDRVFNRFWNDLPSRTGNGYTGAFQVKTTEDGWTVDVPLPGIDPKHVTLEAAGNTVTIRAEVPAEEKNTPPTRYEQTLTVPQFLDIDKLTASHRHGLLRLTLPLKESVKPRRIEISSGPEKKQLVA